jgi:hypothetical protein
MYISSKIPIVENCKNKQKKVTRMTFLLYNLFMHLTLNGSVYLSIMYSIYSKGEFYMICPNCSHNNEGGNFCEKCGSKLTDSITQETAATLQSTQVQSNQYLEATKKVSKMYFNFFLEVLKKPYASTVGVGKEHFINGIITLILFSFFVPLTMYFGIKKYISDFSESGLGGWFGAEEIAKPSFTDLVLQPTFAYAVLILLVLVITFGAIKMAKVELSFQEAIARFGSFLIPFVGILLLALILSILKIKFFLYILLLGFFGAILTVPPLVIASYKKNSQAGLDVIWGTVITYLLTFIVIKVMDDLLFGSFLQMIGYMFLDAIGSFMSDLG